MKEIIELVTGELTKLHAVEILEYHDKNLLAFDNKKRSEEKQNTLNQCIGMLGSVSSEDLDMLRNKIELLEEDLECIVMYLNDCNFPVAINDEKLSIVGRIKSQFPNIKMKS